MLRKIEHWITEPRISLIIKTKVLGTNSKDCALKKISPSETKFLFLSFFFFFCYDLVELWNYKCGPDPKMCIYADSSSFPQFVWDKILNTVYTFCGKIYEIRCCLWKIWIWNSYQVSSSYYYYLVQDLRCWQWWVFVMGPGLGHPIIWYICLCWRSIVGLSSQASKRWRQYVLTETFVPTSQFTQSSNLKQYNFES